MLWFAVGVAMLFFVVDSALRSFVLPRGVVPPLTRGVTWLRVPFQAVARARRTYDGRDAVMAMYAPIFLMVLPLVWLVLVIGAFTAMFHALGVSGFERAFEMSGSSLFTLGFVRPPDATTTTLAFVEATVGLASSRSLIAYLPTIYAAASPPAGGAGRAAGGPVDRAADGGERARPLAADGALRAHERPVGRLAELVRGARGDLGTRRSASSASSGPRGPTGRGVTFVRRRSSTARPLRLAAVDLPFDPQAGLCVRAGFVALDAVAEYFHLPFDPAPRPTDPISIGRDEFDDACERLAAAGIPIRADRDQAWRDFAGWRVNYDQALLASPGCSWRPTRRGRPDRSPRTRRRARDGFRRATCSRVAGSAPEADEPLRAEDVGERVVGEA